MAGTTLARFHCARCLLADIGVDLLFAVRREVARIE